MFNIINGYAPKYLCFKITGDNSQHSHNTMASARSCIVPRVNHVATGSFSSTFFYGLGLQNSDVICTTFLLITLLNIAMTI